MNLLPRPLFSSCTIDQRFWSFNYWSFVHFLFPSHSNRVTWYYVSNFRFFSFCWSNFYILWTCSTLHLLWENLSALNSRRSFRNLVKFVFSQCRIQIDLLVVDFMLLMFDLIELLLCVTLHKQMTNSFWWLILCLKLINGSFKLLYFLLVIDGI